MDIRKTINEFEKNKLELLERARMIITVGKPSLGCNVEELVIENDKRMNLVSWFLYYYNLLEVDIKNYKYYSIKSNYDEETIQRIIEKIDFDISQYKEAVQQIIDWMDV